MRHREQHFARTLDLLGNILRGVHAVGFFHIFDIALFLFTRMVPSFRTHFHDGVQIVQTLGLLNAPVGGQSFTCGAIVRIDEKIAKQIRCDVQFIRDIQTTQNLANTLRMR